MKTSWLALLSLWAAVFNSANAHEPSQIQQVNLSFASVDGVSLEGLASGEVGEGWLLYTSAGHPMGHPALAVHLTKNHPAAMAVAEVFDAPAGLDYVPLLLGKGTISISPSYKPSITVKAQDGFWIKDGNTNFNLDIFINGPIYAMWGGGYDPASGPLGWAALIKHGQPAVRIQVADPDYDGAPDWDLRTLLPAFPGQAVYRSNYAERKCPSPLVKESGVSPLWPFVALSGDYQQPPGLLRPPIVVDWGRARITHFSELVTVRNQNCSYSLYTLQPLLQGAHNQVDFEAPFAFYDLSGHGSGHPNLILRSERYFEADPWLGGLNRPFETIRYSWRNQPGDWKWDFKVEVLGFLPYAFDTPLAGGLLSIDAPPYQAFPAWVVEQNWPLVTFVADEEARYLSSEGIYDWSPRQVGQAYFLGYSGVPDPSAFKSIREGLRGEFRLLHDLAPRLYLSRVDGRLHLRNAQAGLWNLGAGWLLREHNLSGGPYLDGWTRERLPVQGEVDLSSTNRSTVVEEALYMLGGYVIYSGADDVVLLASGSLLPLLETLPPTDPASWRLFRSQVDRYDSKKRDPFQIKRWLDGISGEKMVIQGGRLSDVRTSNSGFRFLLELEDSYSTTHDMILNLKGLTPGQYLVEYEGGFSIRPSSQPALSLDINRLSFGVSGAPILFLAEALNNGLEDTEQAQLILEARQHEEKDEFFRTYIDLVSRDRFQTMAGWQPQQPGAWEIVARIESPAGEILASQSGLAITVRRQRPEEILVIWRDNVTPFLAWPILLFSACLLGSLARRQVCKV